MAVKKRLVLAGLGSIGQRHARLLRERSDIELELLDPDATLLKRTVASLGPLPTHSHFDDMLRTQPDIVWLATPTHLHAQQSIAALVAGAHVFCEKPMTSNLKEARELATVVKQSGLVFNIGFYLHFAKAIARLKQLIQEGRLGHVVHIHFRVGTYITLKNSVSRYQAEKPGSLFTDYAHHSDLVCWLLNEFPKSVTVGATEAGILPLSSTPNSADILFQYNGKRHAHIHLNYIQSPQRHFCEVVGDQAWASLDIDARILQIGTRDTEQLVTEHFAEERDEIFRAEHQAFFDALADRRVPESPADHGVVNAAIGDAIYQAWMTGKETEISY